MAALRYARLLGVQLRTSALIALQYRYDFLVDGLIAVFQVVAALVPLVVVFGERQSVAGWTYGEALLVVGWFTLLKALMDGAINPSLAAVVEHIRKGTLDFVLLKPADAQFLVSTSRFEPWRSVNVLTAVGIFIYAFREMGRVPAVVDILASVVLLLSALLLLYSLWILTISAAFYVVRVDNLTHLFNAIYDAARWPVSVFPGVVRFVFTFLLPLALLTTFPAQAMLGTLPPATFVACLVGSVLFALLGRFVWLRSIARYTSASS